jgi:hypothetical protein
VFGAKSASIFADWMLWWWHYIRLFCGRKLKAERPGPTVQMAVKICAFDFKYLSKFKI